MDIAIPCPCGFIHNFPWNIPQTELDKGIMYLYGVKCECGNVIKLLIKNPGKAIKVAELKDRGANHDCNHQ